MRRLPHKMQKDCTFLNLNGALPVTCIRLAFMIFFRHQLHFNAVDTADELRFKDGLALLLAAFVARAGASAVDAGGDGYAIYFKCLVAIDADEEAVEAVGERDGYFGDDLKVGVGWRDNDCGAMFGLLFRRIDID
jgi:hypothetical protein